MPYKHWRIPIPATNQLRIDTVVAMMYQMGWELHDPGVKGTATLTATSKPTNGMALTIKGKNYSFRPTLAGTEGEVLIGATTADCMANMSNALNHTGTPNVDYTCAVADPYLSATYDADHIYLEARRVGDYCRNTTLTMNAFGSLSSATLVGGTPIVLKSNGEKGNRPYGYVGFDPEYSSDNYFFIRVCLYWDLATHVGSCFANGSNEGNYSYFSPSEFFTVCGSKDLVVFHAYLNGTSYSTRKLFGHFPARDELITRTTAGITAGRRVSVAVQSAIGLASGMVVTIVGLSEGRDKLIISSVPDSTHIVIENLPRDYAAGAYIGTPAMIFGCNSGSDHHDWYEVANPSHVGLVEGSNSIQSTVSTYGLSELVFGDPDDFTWRYKLSPIHAGGDSTYPSLVALQNDGNFGTIEGCVPGDILFINKDRSEPEAGTISFTTPTTLTDSTKNWLVNSLVGKNICIVNGPFSTVVRKIVSNTATVITVDCDWKLAQLPVPSDYPAPGWSYRIADWTWRAMDVGHLSYYGHFCYRETDFTFTL